jgi:ABC-type branched-subunit amino acid transport system substrate-binding protein
MLNFRQAGILAISSAVAVSICACSAAQGGGSSSGDGSGTSSAFKIAYVADLTGPVAAAAGLPAQAGFISAVKYINSHGGSDGHQLDVTTFDSQSDPTAAQAAFEKAASGGFEAVSSEVNSSEQVAANQVLSAANIPVVSTANDPPLTNTDWWYTVAPTSAAQATSAVTAAAGILGTLQGKKIALAVLNDAAGQQFVSVVESAAAAAGASVVATSQDPSTITSFTSQATTIASHHPDLVLTFNTPSVAEMEHKALAVAGLTTQPIIGVLQTYGSTELSQNKLPNSYAVLASQPDPPASSLAVTTAKAAGFGGTDFSNPFFAQSWAAAFVLADTLGRCGTDCKLSNFQNIAQSTTFNIPGDLLFGTPKFTAASHFGLSAIQAYRWDAQSDSAVAAGKVIPLATK